MKLNSNIKMIGVREVDGQLTKLKGYSKLKFFSYKIGKYWSIREFYTGREVGEGLTEAKAKQDARKYLEQFLHDQIIAQIAALAVINGD